jgi:hypothetical protein
MEKDPTRRGRESRQNSAKRDREFTEDSAERDRELAEDSAERNRELHSQPVTTADFGHEGDQPTLSSLMRILSVAFLAYGGLTLGAWLYGAIGDRWASLPLAALGFACGALALVTGALLRRRARVARLPLVLWLVCLSALNAGRLAEAGSPLRLLQLLAAGLIVAAIFALCLHIGRSYPAR